MSHRSPRVLSLERTWRPKRPNVSLSVEPLEGRCLLSISMVQDINARTLSSFPEALTEVAGTVFFIAADPVVGRELWKTDGTSEGTVLVKDIYPGAGSAFSFPNSYLFAAVGDTLFFVAQGDRNSPALWRSDGTEEGTIFLKNVDQPNEGDLPVDLVNLNGTLVFRSNRFGELWKSDGTPEGTVRIWNPDTAGFRLTVRNLQAAAGRVFFTGSDLVPGMGSRYGSELWSTDGTQDGTTLVRDIVPGASNADPLHLTAVGDALFFNAVTPAEGRELWTSDGTQAGTRLVRDIAPGTASGMDGRPRAEQSLMDANGIAYFTASDGRTGHELWRSDGTAEGTVLVRDIRPGASSSFDNESYNPRLRYVHGMMYLVPNDGTHGRELWKSDGTEQGTMLVKDIYSGQGSSMPSGLSYFAGALYFGASDRTYGSELWRSDGTEAGTELVGDFNPGTADSNAGPFLYQGMMLLNLTTLAYGAELWCSDGTLQGTELVRDIQYAGLASSPDLLTAAAGRLFFVAEDGYNGRELWMRDPATGTTELLWEGEPGSVSSFPSGFPPSLVEMNGVLYFTPRVAARFPLWRTDGTRKGTWQVWGGTATGGPRSLVNVNGTLFFSALQTGIGEELWKSDGTLEGTVLVRDIDPGTPTSNPTDLTNVAGTLYFVAQTRNLGRELWKSDGTEEGTVLVKDLNPGGGSAFSSRPYLTSHGQNVFFHATNGAGSWQLWRSDGTEKGTFSLGDPVPDNMYSAGDLLFFAGSDTLHGRELWRSDGTVEGTYLVRDLVPGQTGGLTAFDSPRRAMLNGTLYFTATDEMHGSELWRSDGTKAGTYLVRDIHDNPPSANSGPSSLLAFNGLLYFGATHLKYGVELWQSDGTEEGTQLAADLAPGQGAVGPRSSSPRFLTLLGERFYFSAQDAVHGVELWEFNLDEGTLPGGTSGRGVAFWRGGELLFSRNETAWELPQRPRERDSIGTTRLREAVTAIFSGGESWWDNPDAAALNTEAADWYNVRVPKRACLTDRCSQDMGLLLFGI